MPPADLRYLRAHHARAEHGEGASARVMSFLQSVYDSVAETLPDCRDDGVEVRLTHTEEEKDPYAAALGVVEKIKAQPHAQKLRMCWKSARRNPDRRHLEVRHLPPGRMKEYYEQMVATHPEDKVAFSTFWYVWHAEFSHLKFRGTSSHSMCSVCVRHKAMLRELSGHLRARAEQQRLYVAHLKSQYEDRLVYYSLRGSSRLRSPFQVTLIIDGMDQAKFCYPRAGELFRSKDLCGMQRPRAHITGIIVHGHMLLFSVSEANVPKSSTTMIELLSHCLHLLSKKLDLTRIQLQIQSDNTCREVKNNPVVRWLSSLTSHGQGCEMRVGVFNCLPRQPLAPCKASFTAGVSTC